MNDDILAASCRIGKLESATKPHDSYQYAAAVTTNSQAASSSVPVNQPTRASVTTRVGKRSNVNSVKAIKPPLSCFVSRLDPKTTAEDLQQYLDEVGIKDAECWKIEPKGGRVFKTAAFKVSCREQFRELFYDENNWLEGADLRDWVYRRRDPTVLLLDDRCPHVPGVCILT